MIEPSDVELACLPHCSRQYIDDLERRVSDLEAALKPFAEISENVLRIAADLKVGDDFQWIVTWGHSLLVKDFRKAKEVFGG